MAEKIDVLVKGIPVQLHNIFQGFCAMKSLSVNDGMIEGMAAFIEQTGGGKNAAVEEIMAELRKAGKK